MYSVDYLGTNGEIDAEKVKNALEKVKDINIDKLSSAFVQMLRVYSDLATKIGQIQKENQEAFDSMSYLSLIAPQLLKKLAKEAPPKEFGAFIKAFFDLIEIGPKLEHIMDLSAEEKIEVGQKLAGIADVLEEMVKSKTERKECEKT